MSTPTGRKATKSVKASKKQRQIFYKLGFFTNGLAGEDAEPGEILPKHAWDRGTIDVMSNRSHGIKSQTVHFNSLSEISRSLEKAILRSGVTIHPGARSQKLIAR